MKQITPYALGATLYMPALREDILDIVFRHKLSQLRSLVVCLEDAVAEVDVPRALEKLHWLLTNIEQRGGRLTKGPLLFVRPRDAAMAAVLNDWPLIKHIDGFVLPKIRLSNLSAWSAAVTNPNLLLMPTLETADVFNPNAMVELGSALKSTLDKRIIALRIGGNDLLGCLGLRRNPQTTLYDTPMGYAIPMLVSIMGTQGFALTAPVFEQLASSPLLKAELELDIAHGLVGKTAIHPSQINTIQHSLRVSLDDLNSANLLLSDSAPAVFQYNGAMCEPATHLKWAMNILQRAKLYGVKATLKSNQESHVRLAGANT
ncbi:MAG TPA: HpcH/HpaI aldolase/citrate lyase family protein [Marinospirillum sp.]|uniref:HpcH/HpaI aldolase/citrate lyase family protein n=1 Tax=Marinospirillum sp. TaxID=2183934 RepID=UPI002B4A8431|nr:HpcH/HpaI aldolase/citrate lyase family protein [Marinospirillum sp.]HKM15783.1 HpcH/HpaI aldolase/citrate lyase family protein [Marinospirillum sp.]